MTDKAIRPRRPTGRPTIGFLVDSITEAHGSALWSGVMDAARTYDANLICFQGNHLESPDGFLAQGNVIYRLASADTLDGLVFSSATLSLRVSSDAMQRFAEKYRPLPRVSLGLPLKGIPSLTVENYQGMREVITHLIETHGFRRIAFISGPQWHPESKPRYQAYVDVLTESGLTLDLNLVSPPTKWTEASGREAVCVLLDERGLQPGLGFEAVAASNDETALGALIELQMRGIHVPSDVAVTGFDGFEKGEYCTPPLTSVRQPVYEQAYLAVELVLAQLRGEDVPHQKHMPTELVIRQSCSCPNPMVAQAAVGLIVQPPKKAPTREALPAILETYSEQIHAEMINAAGTAFESLDPAWMKMLVAAFFDDMMGKSSNAFGLALDMVIRETVMIDWDVKTWQNVMSAHRRHVLPHLSEKEDLYRAEDLWQQARVIIAEATDHFRAYRESQARQQAQRLREIGQTLITTFDLATSTDVLAERLPELGFPSCYLALYEDPERPEAESNLIFAYNENGRIGIPPSGMRFLSGQLAPRDLLPAHRPFSAVVAPLYFQDQQLGLLLCETGPRDGTIYESLRGQISGLLQGTLLMQQVQQHTAQLDIVVTETLATSEEMRVTISEMARQAQAVADAAQRSLDVSRTGQDAVTNTMAGMETIRHQVEDTAQSILALSERTQQIGEIVSAVEDIADQSRLLALNASIEAARAGDEGLGFAVVAREMRHLAGQSREATARVSAILNEIQQAAVNAVMVTEEGSKGAQAGMELANRAGDAIRDLATTIDEAARVAIQIAASTHQQTNAMNQLVAAMQSAKEASARTTVSIKEAGRSGMER
jgi:DNA-binding LacI/PurR family transcriptional regulator